MNYEKRYNEILAKARTFYKKWDGVDAYNSTLAISELKEIFPELKESEDENIRQSLIDYLRERQSCESYGQYVLRYDRWITWLENFDRLKSLKERVQSKQGEQKPNDRFEPMFHEGDFIKNNITDIIYKIITVNSGSYYVENIKTGWRIELSNAEQNFHLWSVEDVKDGDVLCTYECGKPKIVFILKGIPMETYLFHCYYNIMYPYFESDSKAGCLGPNEKDVKPATEEQRGLLFQKMKEAGYEWHAIEKELTRLDVTEMISMNKVIKRKRL